MSDALVLDACCGSRMSWFDKNNPLVIFGDLRQVKKVLGDGRAVSIAPDIILDFRGLPFPDGKFKLVSFDPPHLERAGPNGWQGVKYGTLGPDWREDIRKGFSECFRVLEDGGVLVFKWNETHIKTSELLKLTKYRPMFGHISGKRSNTHWVLFMKSGGLKLD